MPSVWCCRNSASPEATERPALPVMNAATLRDPIATVPDRGKGPRRPVTELRIPALRSALLPAILEPGAGDRPGLSRRRCGGLRARYLHRAVDDLVERCGDRHLQIRGVADLCRTQRDRRRVPHPHARAHIEPYVYPTPPISTCATVLARWCRWPSSLPAASLPTVT